MRDEELPGMWESADTFGGLADAHDVGLRQLRARDEAAKAVVWAWRKSQAAGGGSMELLHVGVALDALARAYGDDV